MHPFVVGEIACGTLSDRSLILGLLQQLPQATVAEPDEVLGYIERHKLYGKGIGYVDVHLLASAAISATRIWTRDKSLYRVAESLGWALPEPRRS
jgi:predicted nucleic acid-binding protein